MAAGFYEPAGSLAGYNLAGLVMRVRAAESHYWIEDMACELVSRATKGWQKYDAEAAAESDEPSIEQLTQIGLIQSRFEVTAVGATSGVIANLLLTACGPEYMDGVTRRVDKELAASGVVDQWKIERRLSGWRLTVTGEIVKEYFDRNPQDKSNEYVRRDVEVLDEKGWSSVRLVSVRVVEPPAKPPQPTKRIPHWDSATGELTFDGKVVRTVAVRAYSVRAILDAFQAKGWPLRISDPPTEELDHRDIPTTCRSLRNGLRVIDFRPDGTGKGYRWMELDGN